MLPFLALSIMYKVTMLNTKLTVLIHDKMTMNILEDRFLTKIDDIIAAWEFPMPGVMEHTLELIVPMVRALKKLELNLKSNSKLCLGEFGGVFK